MLDYTVMELEFPWNAGWGKQRLSEGYRIVAVLDSHLRVDLEGKVWKVTVLVEYPTPTDKASGIPFRDL